jgi:hypothetical protein
LPLGYEKIKVLGRNPHVWMASKDKNYFALKKSPCESEISRLTLLNQDFTVEDNWLIQSISPDFVSLSQSLFKITGDTTT